MTQMTKSVLPNLLTADDERALARRIEAGVLAQAVIDGNFPWPLGASSRELELIVIDGEQAWHQFILANLRMVFLLAGRGARRSGTDKDEFVQEGAAALAEALRRFDHHQGIRFSTYATPWVRNAIHRHVIMRGGLSDRPVWQELCARRVARSSSELALRLGRQPSAHEIADDLQLSVELVERLQAYRVPVSLDDVERALQLSCHEADRDMPWQGCWRPEWFSLLGSREREVLALRHGLDDGIERERPEVARVMGISVSTVRRAEMSALRQARDLLGDGRTAA
ncbi:sigma factor [Luteococcus sp. Sow4_B9]|uniref:sigma factor n=1 Tax=Luteococcus sp. Sow4_B9 TaxID=3438792 RepID=UPI003F97C314